MGEGRTLLQGGANLLHRPHHDDDDARRGGNIEVTGLMQCRVDAHALIVTDSFAPSAEGTKPSAAHESIGKWVPAPFGPLDSRLGTSTKSNNCTTCDQNLTDCIDRSFRLYRPDDARFQCWILPSYDSDASMHLDALLPLLHGEQRESFMKQISNPSLDYLRRKALHKKMVAAGKKISICVNCGNKNGMNNFINYLVIYLFD